MADRVAERGAVPVLDPVVDHWCPDPWTEFAVWHDGAPSDLLDSRALTVTEADRERLGEEATPSELVPSLPGELAHPLTTATLGAELASVIGMSSLATMRDGSLVDLVVATERLKAWADACAVEATAELTSRCAALRGVGSGQNEVAAEVMAANELAPALRASMVSASARVALAQALRRLPATRAALASATIDLSRARAVVDAVAGLDDEAAASVEGRVMARAGTQSRPAFMAALRRAVLAADSTAARHRREAAVRERGVWRRAIEDGLGQLTYVGPVEQVEAAYQWISSLARNAAAGDVARAQTTEPATPSHGPSDGHDLTVRTLDQCRADVLADLATWGRMWWPQPPCACRDAASAGRSGGRPGRPLVQVVVAASTLLGDDDEPAELIGVGPITAAAARAVAADATWQRLLVEPGTGRLLDMSSQRYEPPESMRAFVQARDRTCRGPGCRMPASRCDLDHSVSWPCGATCPGNLCALCRRHHRIKTLTDTRVVNDGCGGLTWTTPLGRTYVRPADAVLEHPRLVDPHGDARTPENAGSPDLPPF